jgi:hypothetical protein
MTVDRRTGDIASKRGVMYWRASLMRSQWKARYGQAKARRCLRGRGRMTDMSPCRLRTGENSPDWNSV